MSTAFTPADILLPKDVDMHKWAVIACDQFTSEPSYWEETERITKDSMTTLDLILPEVYLNDPDAAQRIDKIHTNMYAYLDMGVFEEYKNALIYVERTQTDGVVRAGIVGAIDLEQYDYHKGSGSQVRATEATVAERIPPRIKVREKAPIELPHIMILIDDVQAKVIAPLAKLKDDFKKLYSFELMQGGGKIEGWLIESSVMWDVFDELDKLADKKAFNERYGTDGEEPLVYAVGDGNHSLATAKEYYERLKQADPYTALGNCPARYALAEIVDLHSPALKFEAIHRIVKGVSAAELVKAVTEALELRPGKTDGEQSFAIVSESGLQWYTIGKPSSKLTVGSVQNFLDEWCSNTVAEIDYIHGEDSVKKLCAQSGVVGFILPDMGKEELFPTVIADGALPRKTFSMGHARDKRYYVEARKIAD